MPHWVSEFVDYRTMGNTSVPIPGVMRVLTKCMLIVSVLIIGGADDEGAEDQGPG